MTDSTREYTGKSAAVPSKRWAAAFWALLGATTLLRLIYSAWLPLTGDEAYFWEWSRHPALAYYDHPPLAGWLLVLTRSIMGESVLAVRVLAVLTASLVFAVAYLFALRITKCEKRAAFTALLAMGMPLLEVSGILYSTDTPVLLAGAVGGYLFYLAAHEGHSQAWWGLGVCFAIVMLSKFLGIALPAACFLFLLVSPSHRRLLATRGPWIAASMGVLGFIPVLVWNAQNGWATFVFNFASRHSTPSLGLSHLLDYLLGQGLALGPLSFLFGIPLLLASRLPVRDDQVRVVEIPAFLALVPLGGFLGLSLVSKVGLHWPGIGASALAVALGTYLTSGKRKNGWFWATALAGWLLTVALFLLPVAAPLVPEDWSYPLRPDKINAAQLRKASLDPHLTGGKVARAMASLPADTPSFVFTGSYALSSLVAFYTPGHPEVTVLGGGSAHGRNHYFWFDPAAHTGENAVFVSYQETEGEIRFLGERFERHETFVDSSPGEETRIILCFGYRGIR